MVTAMSGHLKVCLGSIFNLLFFGVNGLFITIRYPDRFVGFSVPVRTIRKAFDTHGSIRRINSGMISPSTWAEVNSEGEGSPGSSSPEGDPCPPMLPIPAKDRGPEEGFGATHGVVPAPLGPTPLLPLEESGLRVRPPPKERSADTDVTSTTVGSPRSNSKNGRRVAGGSGSNTPSSTTPSTTKIEDAEEDPDVLADAEAVIADGASCEGSDGLRFRRRPQSRGFFFALATCAAV